MTLFFLLFPPTAHLSENSALSKEERLPGINEGVVEIGLPGLPGQRGPGGVQQVAHHLRSEV